MTARPNPPESGGTSEVWERSSLVEFIVRSSGHHTAHGLAHPEALAVTASAAKVSACEAEHVALARRPGCKLVTTDRLVLQTFSDAAVRLSDFIR